MQCLPRTGEPEVARVLNASTATGLTTVSEFKSQSEPSLSVHGAPELYDPAGTSRG